jgi:hypothetical protein
MPALCVTYLVASRLLLSHELNRVMEVTMSKAKWILAAGLIVLAAGCARETTTYYPRGSAYYQPQPQPRGDRYWNSARADYDRDGIPNRYDRDANGDGVPDRYQRRY